MARRRKIGVAALLVVGTLLLFVGSFSIWVNRQVLNTDNWVTTSTRLLANEEIDKQLSTFLVGQAYEHADVQEKLAEELPPATKPLAGPISGGLRQLSEKVAERTLSTPAFQKLWEESNRAAHEALLKILNGGGSFASTGEGKVTLDLHALLTGVVEEAGLPSSVLEKLPPDAGQLTVLESKQLSAAQKIAKIVRHLPLVLMLLVLIFYGAAIYLARGRRRETVRSVGFGFVIVGVALLAIRGLAGDAVVNALSATDSVEAAAAAAWGIGTSLLVGVAVSGIAFGILVLIGAWVVGPTAPAQMVRRQASPWLRDNPAAVYLALGLLWLALIAWVPIAAFRTWWGILIFAALFAIGATIFGRRALAEFPDAEKQGLGRAFSRMRAADADPLEQLERLNTLRREGVLTDEEFEAQKRKLLAAGTA